MIAKEIHRWALGLAVLWLASSAGAQVAHHFVNVETIRPPIAEDIRYATSNNFTHQVLYPFPAAFVEQDVARALTGVQQDLVKEGLSLKIFDGYRPISVQRKMWDLVRDARYVSDPSVTKGRHTRGTAVDVTLVDLAGRELPMPTPFDDFTERAHRDSAFWTETERTDSQKLEAVMVKHGFLPYRYEWWHFDFKGWEKYPPFDISFEELRDGVQMAVPAP